MKQKGRPDPFVVVARDDVLVVLDHACCRKAVKSIAALVETSSEENKATVLALCAALDDD